MTAPLHDRLNIAMENLRNTKGLRPRDLGNFFQMMRWMPRTDRQPASNLSPGQVALALFTQMRVAYAPETSAEQGDPILREALPHTREPTVALFVDSPEHLSGVSLTLQGWAEEAQRRGLPFFLHMAGSESRIPGAKSFPKVGNFRFRSYDGLDVPVPDVRSVTEFLQGHPFDVAHLSTPGPMGLLGMRLARDAGVPVCGTYHTDFPRYVGQLTGNELLESMTWEFMVWFYGQMDRVAAPSAATKADLVAHGLDPDRVTVVGRGVELDDFSPNKRDETLRQSWGAEPGTPVLLYVGRVSVEKNLPLLAEAYARLHEAGCPAKLVVVGDGPYLEEMRARLADTPAVFTGVLRGEALHAAFASGDLFVFPSVTDTFGRVVIEAQASGLPVLVSDEGGPRDAVLPEHTGRIVPGITEERFASAIREILADPTRLAEWKRNARAHARQFTPAASFESFWNLHHFPEPANTLPEARHDHQH